MVNKRNISVNKAESWNWRKSRHYRAIWHIRTFFGRGSSLVILTSRGRKGKELIQTSPLYRFLYIVFELGPSETNDYIYIRHTISPTGDYRYTRFRGFRLCLALRHVVVPIILQILLAYISACRYAIARFLICWRVFNFPTNNQRI